MPMTSLTDLNLDTLLTKLREITSQVGEFQRDKLHQPIPIEKKGANDLVSYVDKTSEQHIKDYLQDLIPEASFVGEESGQDIQDSPLKWVVDPLDGTTNYLHQVPTFSTSIALLLNDVPVLGIVHEHMRDEFFSATKGNGAFLNGKPIEVTKTEEFQNALVATGFPYDSTPYLDGHLAMIKFCLLNTRGVRRIGSAAVDLAYIAAGRFDAYYEYNLNIWDIAAGVLIVQEAGGQVTDFWGKNNFLHGETLVATNQTLHSRFLTAMTNTLCL